MKKIVSAVFFSALFLLIGWFYSFRLTQVPPGLTVDEAAIGYNAVLISRTLRDETGDFLPPFVLTVNRSDWKQPISIYSTAIVFKLLGPTLFNLRLVNVLVATISLGLLILLNYHLLGQSAAIIAGLIYISTPAVLIHSHLAQENLMPVLFVSAWLLFMLLFQKRSWPTYLVLAGLSLGLGLYSYKGMRALTPPLILTSLSYLLFTTRDKLKNSSLFVLGLLPFLLLMPYLYLNYAGALFDSQGFRLLKYYDFFYPYLSSFDLSALFIKGDSTPWHSTGLHGVFLLATLPVFVFGTARALTRSQNSRFYLFMLVSFFLCPLLFGQLGSVYRFSRLLIFVPFYVSFTTLGIISLQKLNRGKLLSFVLAALILANFIDFARYYWFVYSVVQRESFSPNIEASYQKLSQLARTKGLIPYVFKDDYLSQGEDAHFFEAAYFLDHLGQWQSGNLLPHGSILMTKLENQPGMVKIEKEGDMNYLVVK